MPRMTSRITASQVESLSSHRRDRSQKSHLFIALEDSGEESFDAGGEEDPDGLWWKRSFFS